MTRDKMPARSNRDKNYSDQECIELIRAIKKYAYIIENRKQGRCKNEERAAAWDAVCKEFNAKTSQNRSAISLKTKWKNDKSNVRDYIQYLKTSKSRSGRQPNDIPKVRFMDLIANIIGIDCPAVGPVPNSDTPASTSPVNVLKQEVEPTNDITDLSFEQIMLNENTGQFDYTNEESSTADSFHENLPENYEHESNCANGNQIEHSISKSSECLPMMNGNNREIENLQIELLQKQIRVQDLMAAELEAKIERTRQLVKLEAAESELRCREICKRLEP